MAQYIMARNTRNIVLTISFVFSGTILCTLAVHHSIEPSIINGYITSYVFKYVIPSISLTSLILVTIFVTKFSCNATETGMYRRSVTCKLTMIFFTIFGLGNVLRNLLFLAMGITCLDGYTTGKSLRNSLAYLLRVSIFMFEIILMFLSFFKIKDMKFVRGVRIAWYLILIDTMTYCVNSSIRDIYFIDTFEDDELIRNDTVHYRYPIPRCNGTNHLLLVIWNATFPFLMPTGMEYFIILINLTSSLLSIDKNERINNEEDVLEVYEMERLAHCKYNRLPLYSLCISLIISITGISLDFVSNYMYNYGEKGIVFFKIGKFITAVEAGLANFATAAGFFIISRFGMNTKQYFNNNQGVTAHIYLLTLIGEITFSAIGILTSVSKKDFIDTYVLLKNTTLLLTGYYQTVFIIFAFTRDYASATYLKIRILKSVFIFVGLYNLKTWFIASSFGLRVNNLRQGHPNEGEPELIGYSGWIVLKDVMSPLAIFYRLFSAILCYSMYNDTMTLPP